MDDVEKLARDIYSWQTSTQLRPPWEEAPRDVRDEMLRIAALPTEERIKDWRQQTYEEMQHKRNHPRFLKGDQ